MKSTAERVRALRDRRRKAGLVKVEVWVPPEAVERVKRYAARCTGKKERGTD